MTGLTRATSESLSVIIDDPEVVATWREKARALDRALIPPDRITWVEGTAGQSTLFGGASEAVLLSPVEPPRRVPRALVELLMLVVRHGSAERFNLAYRLLWRSRSEPRLASLACDADMSRAYDYAKSVRRDAHKMKAFVRFRSRVDDDGQERFVAWFEPQHHVVSLTAPFFARRYANMRFSILTPRASVHWDTRALAYGVGVARSAAPSDDEMEELWRTYFSSIFNPARLKVAAMTSEMPKKYWRNLPEGSIVEELIRSAQKRTEDMVAAPGLPSRRLTQTPSGVRPTPVPAPALPVEASGQEQGEGEDGSHILDESRSNASARSKTLTGLYAAASACNRCSLYACATRLVPGTGPKSAQLMIVGEQPGDQEDIAGKPFVGPAGRVLDEALKAAGIDRRDAFLTNAVKHFKHEQRGKQRLHKTPSASEMDHCRWWLLQEIALVKPKLIVALGASAARSLLGRPVRVNDVRGRVLSGQGGLDVVVSVHPSFLLRLRDETERTVEMGRFVSDLSLVAGLLSPRSLARAVPGGAGASAAMSAGSR